MKETNSEHQEYNEVIHALQVATFRRETNKRDFSAASCATGLSSSWLGAFADGRIREAGFFKVRRLQAWLSRNGYLSNNNKQPATHTPADSCSPDFGATESGVCAFNNSAASGLVEMDCSARGNNESLMEG